MLICFVLLFDCLFHPLLVLCFVCLFHVVGCLCAVFVVWCAFCAHPHCTSLGVFCSMCVVRTLVLVGAFVLFDSLLFVVCVLFPVWGFFHQKNVCACCLCHACCGCCLSWVCVAVLLLSVIFGCGCFVCLLFLNVACFVVLFTSI